MGRLPVANQLQADLAECVLLLCTPAFRFSLQLLHVDKGRDDDSSFYRERFVYWRPCHFFDFCHRVGYDLGKIVGDCYSANWSRALPVALF